MCSDKESEYCCAWLPKPDIMFVLKKLNTKFETPSGLFHYS